MTGQRILILSSSHLCRNPRVLKEATTLGEAGYAVTLLSVSTRPEFERCDRELLANRPFQRVVINYSDPDRRLASFCQRAATYAARWACVRLGWQLAQALGPAHALLRAARRIPADLTIAHTEIPLWAAEHLSCAGRRCAVDFEDWYSEDLLPADRRSRPLRLLRQAESSAMAHGAYTSTTSDCLAAELAEAYGGAAPVTIRNSFPLQPRSRLDRPDSSNAPSLVWFSQTVGPGRGLEMLLPAWARTRQPSSLHLIGEVRPAYRETLLGLLPADRRRQLFFTPPVPPEELPATLTGFDVGLALEARTPRSRDLTITNKILQYLNAGLAILATRTAGQTEVMRAAPGCGELIGDETTDALAVQLDRLLGYRARLRSLQAAARSAAEREFCWEQDSPRLLQSVATALRAARTGPLQN